MFRKHGPGVGETIQSYNHQNRKDESLEKSCHSSNGGDDDNIDVVNDDDDRESGKHLVIMWWGRILVYKQKGLYIKCKLRIW